MILVRALAIGLLSALPSGLLANCGGPSLMDMLSEDDRQEISTAVAATPYPEGIFWRARRGGKELRLIGTMHLHDARHDALMERAGPLLEGADLVMLELTRAEETQAETAMMTEPERLFITSGPTLPEQLDEATWAALSEAARDRKIPPLLAAKFQPWYLSMSLAIPPCAMADLVSGLRGLDHRIMDEAGAAGIPMAALEPWDTLFRLLETGSPEEQIDMLRLSIAPTDLQQASIVAMLDGYFEERIAEVWEVSRLSARRVPGLDPVEAETLFRDMQRDLLDRRNLDWMPVIEAALETADTIVIAVGAAHLPGEIGLLNLLHTGGWTIERLN